MAFFDLIPVPADPTFGTPAVLTPSSGFDAGHAWNPDFTGFNSVGAAVIESVTVPSSDSGSSIQLDPLYVENDDTALQGIISGCAVVVTGAVTGGGTPVDQVQLIVGGLAGGNSAIIAGNWVGTETIPITGFEGDGISGFAGYALSFNFALGYDDASHGLDRPVDFGMTDFRLRFTYDPVSIDVLDADNGPLEGGNVISLEGAGFLSTISDITGVVIDFNGTFTYAPDFSVDDDATVTVTMPPHDAGLVDVALEFTDSDTNNTAYIVKVGAYTYTDTPFTGPTILVDQFVLEVLLDYDESVSAALGPPHITTIFPPGAGTVSINTPGIGPGIWPSISGNPTGAYPPGLLPLQPPGDGWTPPTGPPNDTPPFVCMPFAIAVSDLAARLGDPGHVHWTAAELKIYIIEALRTYNAYTLFYRNRESFSSVPGAPFYDLPTMIPELRAYNVTSAQLVTDIEYMLMEPPTPTAWTGSEQFTLEDVVDALQRRRDQFLRETGQVVTPQVITVTVAQNGRLTLPGNVINVRRAAWIQADGTVTPLHRESEWALTNYQRAWQVPQQPADRWPTGYSTNVTPPLTMQIGPPPSMNGTLELLAVLEGAEVDPVANTLIGVPDDWSWVVKFGALSDLLSRAGVANDPQRAAYCEARWQQGLDMATQASVVLVGYVNEGVTRLYSVSEADLYNRTWETTLGTPKYILTTSMNVLGLAPRPDSGGSVGPYLITLDVIANIPVPESDDDCVNLAVNNSELDIIYDYAQHLALFKEGPGQLNEAMALYQRFARACGVTEALDEANFPGRGPVLQQTVQDVRIVARETPPEETKS